MPSILDLIANPTIVDPSQQFREGQQSALAKTLLQGQVAEQEQKKLAQPAIDLAKQKEKQTKQEMAETNLAKAKQGISDGNWNNAIKGLVLAREMPDEESQNRVLATVLEQVSNNKVARNLVQTAINIPKENNGKLIDDLIRGGQQIGAVEERPETPEERKANISGKNAKQKTGAFLIKDDKGNQKIAVGVFDPGTGNLVTETATIPGSQLVSKLGETGAEQSAREVKQKQGEAKVSGQETRASELITRGIAAAESTASIKRAISLLDQVKTGGFRAVALRAKQALGVEGANEGELSNAMGKAVLSQLRETFGAAFTVEEGARLERIEASFTKSPKTNRRLLTQALTIANRTASRAKKAAQKRGDIEAVEDINGLLDFTLDDVDVEKNNTPQENGAGPPVTNVLNFDAQGNLIQ